MLTLGNKLTLNSQPIYKFVNKYSIDFDGVDDRIITDGADTVAQPTTYSFWCKSSSTVSNNRGVFGHGSADIGAFHFNFAGSFRPLLYLGSNYYRFWNDTPAQDDGEWHHWVVYSDTNDITNSKLYVDGVLQTVNTTVTTGSLKAYTESLTIGSERQVGGNSFEGKIDEFAVYDRELTQAEITRMYNTYYSPNRVANGNFSQIGNEEVTNGDFSQEGSEILSQPVDLQTDFVVNSGGVIVDTDTFTTSGGTFDGIKKSGFLTVGKTYKLTIDGNTTSSGFTIGYLVSGNEYGSGFGTHYFTASTSDLWIRQSTSGTTNITSFSIKEVGQDWGVYTSGTSTVTFEEGAVLNIDGSNSNVGVYQENVFANGTNYKIVVNMKATASFDAEILESQGASTVNTIGNVSLTTSYQEFTFYYQGTGTNDLFIHRLSSASGANQKIYIKSASIKEVGQHWIFANGAIVSNDSLSLPASSSLVSAVTNVGTQYAKTFKLTYTIISNDTTGGDFRAGGLSGASILPSLVNLTSTVGTHSISFTSPSSNKSVLDLYLTSANTSGTLVLDNIVLQELKHDATNLMLNHSEYQSANPLITSTKSMEFDGVDNYLIANSTLGSFTGSFSCWIIRDNNSSYDYILDTRGASSGGTGYIYLNTGDNTLVVSSGTRYVDGVAATEVPADGRWHNVVVTGISLNINEDIRFGVSDSISHEFDGKMTEAGLWNRTLTALEVASLYNQGVPTNLLVNRNNYQSGNPTVFNTKQVDFDGTDDYLDLGSQSATSSLTYSAWVYCQGNNSNMFSYGKTIFRCSNTTELKYWSDIAQSNITLTVDDYFNKWTHFVVTQTGTTYAIYQNGIQKGTGTVAAISTTQDNSYIGKFSTQYFNGKISQAGIWNEALTADEVSSLYNHGLPIDLTTDQAAYASSSNLVGYWRMGSGTLDTYPLIADQTNATLGSELVVNGDFATDSDWIKETGWTISGGTANRTNTGTYTALQQNILTSGKTYEVTFTISSITSGEIYGIRLGSNYILRDKSTTGTYTGYGTANGSTLSIMGNPSFAGSIDNVSIKQVQGNPAIMTNQTSSDIENGSPYANLVQNGTFDTDSDWNKGTGWSISGGTASFNTTTNGNINQSGYATNKTYKVSIDVVSYVRGNPFIAIGQGSQFTIPTSIGTHIIYVNSGSTDTILRIYSGQFGAGGEGSIDNLTVEEVNTGLQGYWKMGDGTNDEYPVIYDQVDTTTEAITVRTPSTQTYTENNVTRVNDDSANSVSFTSTSASSSYALGYMSNSGLLETVGNFAVGIYKLSFTLSTNSTVFGNNMSMKWYNTGSSYTETSVVLGENTIYGIINTANNNSHLSLSSSATGQNIILSNITVDKLNGNGAFMTNMVEGNITNQYPLTKIRNYYRMGDGILDGYPIIQDQTSPNLAHIPTTNLFLQSEDFTSEWSTSDATITANSTISPDGTQNASTLTTTASGGTVQESLSISDGDVAFSLFVKKGSTNGVRLRIDAATDFNGYFDLTDGTIHSTTGNAKIEPLANDWYRISISASVTSFVKASVYTTDGTTNYDNGTVFIWGAQIEAQSQATEYIKSDGIAAVRKSSTTNLIPYSEDFSQWTTSNFTANSETTSSPNGETVNGYDFGDGFIYIDTSDVIINKTYTSSIYIKANKSATVGLRKGGAGSFTDNADITLTTDWARYEGISTAGSTRAGRFLLDNRTANGYGVSDLKVFIWHPQLEEQTQAETYAKTTGLPVTIDLFTENNYGTMTNMSASDIVEDTP